MKYRIVLTDEYIEKGYDLYWRTEYLNTKLHTNDLVNNLVSIKIVGVVERIQNCLLENDITLMMYEGILFTEYVDENSGMEVSIPENKVVFTSLDILFFMFKVEFFKLCLQFANKALEAMEVFGLKEKGIVDDKWEQEIKDLIPKIETKVKEVIEKYGEEES